MLYHYFILKNGGSLDLIFDLPGVIDTADIEFADFCSEYLGEYEAKCETALTR
jgi:hypothetical protein